MLLNILSGITYTLEGQGGMAATAMSERRCRSGSIMDWNLHKILFAHLYCREMPTPTQKKIRLGMYICCVFFSI
jgi:hypothetical protein